MRFGLTALFIAAFDLIVFGSMIVARMRISDDWIEKAKTEELDSIARWVMFGNWSMALFPVVAAIGFAVGAFGVFRFGRKNILSLAGGAANLVLLISWLVVMASYLEVFRLDRFYVK